jgi:hypothetical protein
MRSRIAVLVIVATALLAACRHSSPPISPQPIAVEYQVLSAYLIQQAKASSPDSQVKFAIASETITYTEDARHLAAHYIATPELTAYQDAVRSLNDSSSHTSNFTHSFVFPSSVQYEVIFAPKKQPGIYLQPASLIHFSRVGFNRDQTQALFLVSFICGSRCGHGGLILMQKDSHSDWQFLREFDHWAS